MNLYLSITVQAAVIPLLVHNRNLSDIHKPSGDICVSAPTGSGKTLAYVLPIIEVWHFIIIGYYNKILTLSSNC
jgi:hypothetical protein